MHRSVNDPKRQSSTDLSKIPEPFATFERLVANVVAIDYHQEKEEWSKRITDLLTYFSDTIKNASVQMEELEHELIALRESWRWKPVSDGLPKEDGEYRVFVQFPDEEDEVWTAYYYNSGSSEAARYWLLMTPYGITKLMNDDFDFVTHWAFIISEKPLKEEQK